MMIETTVLLTLLIGACLLAGLAYFGICGDVDGVIMIAIALLVGLSTELALVAAIIVAIVFSVLGDGRKAAFAVAGFVLGLALWVGVMSLVLA